MALNQIDIGLRNTFFAKSDLRDSAEIRIDINVGSGDVKAIGKFATIDNSVVAHDTALANIAIVQHRIKADEYLYTGLGVDHDAALDIGIGADGDRFHIAAVTHLVDADDHVRSDKYIFSNDNLAANNRSRVDKCMIHE